MNWCSRGRSRRGLHAGVGSAGGHAHAIRGHVGVELCPGLKSDFVVAAEDLDEALKIGNTALVEIVAGRSVFWRLRIRRSSNSGAIKSGTCAAGHDLPFVACIPSTRCCPRRPSAVVKTKPAHVGRVFAC